MENRKDLKVLFCYVACFNWNCLVVCGYQIPISVSKAYQANVREKTGQRQVCCPTLPYVF